MGCWNAGSVGNWKPAGPPPAGIPAGWLKIETRPFVVNCLPSYPFLYWLTIASLLTKSKLSEVRKYK